VQKANQKGFSIVEALLILVVLGLLGFTGWFVYHAKQSSDKSYSTAANSVSSSTTKQAKAQHGTKVVSLDETYAKYINYDTGISLTYSKMVASRAKCLTTPQIEPTTVSVPAKVYEDAANNKVFVAASKFAVAQSHQISPDVYQGYDSCTVKGTTLEDIEKVVESISLSGPQSTMPYAEFYYTKVKSEAELDAFVAAHGYGIIVDHSIAPTQSNGVSTYKLKGSPYSGVYFLKYNSSKKVAVFWHRLNVQAQVWADVDSSGGLVSVGEPTADL
jgi:Tfp pilus assembly protein PilV